MLFSDMPYVRPDLEFLGEMIAEHVEELKNAQSFEEADRAFDALEKVFFSVDTEDEYYSQEVD